MQILPKLKKTNESDLSHLIYENQKLTSEAEKMEAIIRTYEEVVDLANDIVQVAKLLYWGTGTAREKAQILLEKYNSSYGIWQLWDKTIDDLQSDSGLRRNLNRNQFKSN